MEKAAAFIRSHPTKHFEQGEILIYQDELPEKLFALRSGFVKVHTIAADGSEQIVWLAQKYDFIPLDFLFGEDNHSPYFYTAFTDLNAFVVDREEFMEFIKNDNGALLGMATALAEKYNEVLRHLNAVQQNKAPNKIIQTLSFLSSRFSVDERLNAKNQVTVPLTHQDIASLAGLARETTSHELRKLKNLGMIEYDSSSFTIHSDKLSTLLE